MTKWTADQQKAIVDTGNSLLVAAAAGSGKTAVLVERIIQKISNPENKIDIDQLLVVTFTNAAAMEMKERIGEAIYKQLRENPGSEHLYNQSILLNKANITTLHSFCLDLVRENFYLLDLDPNFKIADETEIVLLKQEAIDEVFEEYYLADEAGEEFIYLVDCYGGKEDHNLRNLILRILDFAVSHPQPKVWINELSNRLVDYDWFTPVLNEARSSIQSARDRLEESIRLSQQEEGLQSYLPILTDELSLFNDLLLATKRRWDDILVIFNENPNPFKRLPNAKKGKYSETVKNQVKERRDYAKSVFESLKDRYFNRSQEDMIIELKELKKPMKFLCDLAWSVQSRYMVKKKNKNLVDFNDMEHFCLQLLQQLDSQNDQLIPSDLSHRLKETFAEVLVDEYQDINNVQESILRLISKENNLFMVGDVKQSIYSFRMANPQLFIDKYNRYPKLASENRVKIDLNQNFRCRKNIVDGVNFIFRHLMKEKYGGITYDEDAMLCFSAHYPVKEDVTIEEKIDVYLLEKNQSKTNDGTEDSEEIGTLAMEGRVIAKKITELISEKRQIWDKETKQYRPITYRDIVILLRSPKNNGDELIEQLQLAGIPAYGESGEGYFSAWEIRMMLSLLKVLDNLQQDIPLVAVLRSPYFSFTADELARIRIEKKDGSFYQSLVHYQGIQNELGEKIRLFLEQIDQWRTLARRNDLSKLIWTLYRETNFYNYVGSLPFGKQRQANLRALHDRARQYEETSFKGLFMFLRFIDKLAENDKDLEPARTLNESENVVRLISIHKSKGLEFPVVFLANMGKKFNLQDSYKDIVLHRDLGFGPYYVDREKNIKYPTLANQVIKGVMKEELLAEEIRILYVALTRAREKLILVGTTNNLEKSITKWSNLQIEIANNYLDWIVPILAKHPDNSSLWDDININIITDNDPSQWNIELVHDLSINLSREELPSEEMTTNLENSSTNSTWQSIVENNLGWMYNWKLYTDKKSKVTVTEIKSKFTTDLLEEVKKYGFSKRPAFLQQQNTLTSAEKGTAIHLMMSKVDLERNIDQAYLNELSNQLLIKELLTENQKESINLSHIESFFSSLLGKRMLKYKDSCYRELPFSFGIDSHIVHPELPKGETNILVQGMIDCLWKEEDGWVLVDYKSDYVSEHNYSHLVKDYTGQVNLYAMAIEEIWKEKIKEKYIYLFSINKAIKI